MNENNTIEQIKKADEYISKRKFKEAGEILDKLIENIDKIEIDEHGRVMDFDTQLGYVLWNNMNPNKKISWNRNFLSEIYLIKGSIKYEQKKYKQAICEYEKALRWNPVNVSIYAEILEVYIKTKELEKFDIYLKKAMKVAVRTIDIAMLYEKAAYVYGLKGENETAYNLFLYSKMFFPLEQANEGIFTLEKEVGCQLQYFPNLGTIQYIKEKKLEYKRPDYVVPTLITVIDMMLEFIQEEEFMNRENYLILIDYYQNLYFHNPDEVIHGHMMAIQEEYENIFSSKKEEK